MPVKQTAFNLLNICAKLHLYPYSNKGSIYSYAHSARQGRGTMTRNMKNIYADMLTKELVALRKRHMEAREVARQYDTRLARKDVERFTDLIDQINDELASRVAAFNIFV